MSGNNVHPFPLADKPVDKTTVREALVEALRMVDTGECPANGVIVTFVDDEVDDGSGNIGWSIQFVMGGKPMSTLSRVIGWVEVMKAMFLKQMFGEEA